VSQDDAQTVDWYRKAAEQGFAGAHYNLGMMYNEGEGVPKHQGKAMGWYKKAVDQGDVEAQFVLDSGITKAWLKGRTMRK
jgi:TPR repeat protein